jgi:predicted lipoprotein
VGSVEVRVPGVTKTVIGIAVGPVLVGTALRDAVGFIDFSQFTNQIDYADAATAINAKVKTEVLKGLDPATLKGKKVSFAGAFQLLDVQSILVTPTKLTVTP